MQPMRPCTQISVQRPARSVPIAGRQLTCGTRGDFGRMSGREKASRRVTAAAVVMETRINACTCAATTMRNNYCCRRARSAPPHGRRRSRALFSTACAPVSNGFDRSGAEYTILFRRTFVRTKKFRTWRGYRSAKRVIFARDSYWTRHFRTTVFTQRCAPSG